MTCAQCTLKDSVEISGVGLFSGKPVSMRCLPAEAGRGIVFIRTDLPGRTEIPCTPEYLADMGQGGVRSTALQNGEAAVTMIEHFMACLFGLEIDNMTVEIGGVELPTGDGSAMTFAAPLAAGGIRELDAPRKLLEVRAPVAVMEGDALLLAAPLDEGVVVTYVLDYGDRFFGAQTRTFTLTREAFLTEIAPARTYCLRPEVEVFIKMGLGGGADRENTLVVNEDGSFVQELRFPDECVRHKILDLLGDVYLAGRLAAARLMGYKSGHAMNARLTRMLCGAGVQ